MKKKTDKKELFHELFKMIAFWAVVFALYKAAGFVHGHMLHRIYKKADARAMQEILARDWGPEGDSIDERLYELDWPENPEPYVVVLLDELSYAYKPENWTVIACSGKKDLSDIKTVVFCRYYTKTAGYGSSPSQDRSSSTGSSQFVKISYVNADFHRQYYWEEIGKELPGRASRTPHYKVSRNKLLSHIKKRLKKGPEGE